MKKFLKYYFKFMTISAPIFILSVIITNLNIAGLNRNFLRYLDRYFVDIYTQLIPLFLITSLMLVFYSFYYFFKKKIFNFKHFLILGSASFMIALIIWGLAGFFRPCFDCGVGKVLTNEQIPPVNYELY